MQLSPNRPSRRSPSPASTVRRLVTVLLAALLMAVLASAQQAPASAEPGLYDFTVSISGPASIYQFDDATYTAVPAHGTAPYSYTWFLNGTQVGTGPSYTVHVMRNSVTVQVNAVDANGNQASASVTPHILRECHTC